MPNVILNEQILTNIAAAIRQQNGSTRQYYPGEMATAISRIEGSSSTNITSLNVSQNGTYTAPSGSAYSPVIVNVSNTFSATDEGEGGK